MLASPRSAGMALVPVRVEEAEQGGKIMDTGLA